MRFAFDPNKAASNMAKHGVSFEAVEHFEWDTALVLASLGVNEPRLEAAGMIDGRLHMMVFTVERGLRVISLRKANSREVRRYAET